MSTVKGNSRHTSANILVGAAKGSPGASNLGALTIRSECPDYDLERLFVLLIKGGCVALRHISSRLVLKSFLVYLDSNTKNKLTQSDVYLLFPQNGDLPSLHGLSIKGLETLWEKVFNRYLPPSCITQETLHNYLVNNVLDHLLQINKERLNDMNSEKKILNPHQWDLLYPPLNTFDIKTLDITLLCFVICNVFQYGDGTHMLPAGIRKDVSMLRKHRNANYNQSSGKDSSAFNITWKDISDILVRLIGQEFLPKVQHLNHCPIDDLHVALDTFGDFQSACSIPRTSWNTLNREGKLDSTIIDAAQEVIKDYCLKKNIGGLQSCLRGREPNFDSETGDFIQIVNTDYDNGGQHWIVLSTVGVKHRGYINIFDSSITNSYTLNKTVQRCIAKLLRCGNDSIIVNIVNCDQQEAGSNDCGPYAIAFLFAIANGLNPTEIQLNNRNNSIRSLIYSRLLNTICTPFPYTIPYEKRKECTAYHIIPVSCTCRMPLTRQMLQCQRCSRSIHSECATFEYDPEKELCKNCNAIQFYHRIPKTSRTTLNPNGKVDDKVIDAAHTIIKGRFPNIGGLQSSLLRNQPSVSNETAEFIQIVNAGYEDGGQHWVVISTVGVKRRNFVNVFDSRRSTPYILHETVARCIASLVKCDDDFITVNIRKCDELEINSNDWGLYAIAFAFAIAYGSDPTQMIFKNQNYQLQRHLRQCLKNYTFAPFPYIPWYRKKKNERYHKLSVHCICRMPKEKGMFQCRPCSRFFHSDCVDYKGAVDRYVCQSCK